MKKLLILGFLISMISCLPDVTYEPTADSGKDHPTTSRDGNLPLVNVGTQANDGTGDGLRTAFGKVNQVVTQVNTNTADILLRVRIADTAAMLSHYIDRTDNLLKVNVADTSNMLSHFIDRTENLLKLSISDTAGMLTHYIDRTDNLLKVNVSDTAAMLIHYIDRTDNLVKLSVSDTATMLAHYALLTEIGGIGVYVDIADSSGNAEGNYITRQDLLVEGGLHVNISDTSTMLSHYIAREDTASMLAAYPRYFYAANGSLTLSGADPITFTTTASTSLALPTSGVLATTQNINDSIDVYLAGAAEGVLVSDTAAMLTPYINRGDTATMLSHYALLSEITASEGISAADTAAMLTPYINRADTASMLSNYPLDTEALLEADVKTFFVFSAGGGNAADTLAMTDSTILGSFYNGGSKSIVVDSLNAIMDHGVGLDTIAFNIVWGKSFQTVSPSGHLSNTQFNCGRTAGTPAQITNLTTGNTFTSFDHTVIPPGCRVWGKFMYVPAASLKRKPKYFEVSLIGHYQ